MNFITNQYFPHHLGPQYIQNTVEEASVFHQNQKNFLSHIWEQMLVLFEREKGKKDTNNWLKSLEILHWNNQKKIITISTPNLFTKQWLEKYFITIMEKIFCRILNEINIKIEFTIKNNSENFSLSTNNIHFSHKKLFDAINQSKFLITQSNETILSAIYYFLETSYPCSSILFIHGPKSIGKTELINEIYHSFLLKKEHTVVLNGKKFVQEYISAARKKSIDFLENNLSKNKILIIDGIEHLEKKVYTQKFLIRIINKFNEENKKIIISGNSNPTDIQDLSIELKNIILEGLVFSFSQLSKEEKKAILKLKIKQYQYNISEDIIVHLVEKSLTISQAENIIHKVIAEEIILKRPTTIAYIEKLVESLYTKKKKNNLNIEEISKKIATMYGISLEQLKNNRTKTYIKIKYLCLYILKKILHIPYQDIVRYFDYKDHTTLSYACQVFEKRYIQEENIQQILSLFS